MNRLHLHLTDDQGWRLEIKKYPRLTEIGARRKNKDGSVYGGFYSCDEMKQIINYASDRFIEVVPEIDLPGIHWPRSRPIPNIPATGGPLILRRSGVFSMMSCAPAIRKHLILSSIFLTKLRNFSRAAFCHFGGDECPVIRWEKHELCRERIRNEKLSNEAGLYRDFIRRIAEYILKREKTPLAWDEAFSNDNPSGMTIWPGGESIKVSSCPGRLRCGYVADQSLLFRLLSGAGNEPKAIGGFLPLEKVYEFDRCRLMCQNPKGIISLAGRVISGPSICRMRSMSSIWLYRACRPWLRRFGSCRNSKLSRFPETVGCVHKVSGSTEYQLPSV